MLNCRTLLRFTPDLLYLLLLPKLPINWELEIRQRLLFITRDLRLMKQKKARLTSILLLSGVIHNRVLSIFLLLQPWRLRSGNPETLREKFLTQKGAGTRQVLPYTDRTPNFLFLLWRWEGTKLFTGPCVYRTLTERNYSGCILRCPSQWGLFIVFMKSFPLLFCFLFWRNLPHYQGALSRSDH